MSYPQFPKKHRFERTFTPERVFDYYFKQGRVPEGLPPKRVILCYQSLFMKKIVTNFEGEWATGVFNLLYRLKNYPEIGVAYFGTGAPKVVLKTELLIAWGVKDFISIGTAGGIALDLHVGDLVGCDRAIRDEGTSPHYLPLEKYSYPTDGGAFASKFKRVGTSWTLDAYFCQTWEEIKHYRDEGVLTVEMESSALFTLAQVRKVSMGSGFVICDLLNSEEWGPDMCAKNVEQGLDTLLALAME